MSNVSGNVLAFRTLPRPVVEPARTPDLLLGPSAAITRVWSQIRRVAPYFRTALITGERATGHEAVAHALHSLSPRSERSFVIVTTAEADRTLSGPATRWSGDTLFVTEIDQISASAQQALLRITRLRRPHQGCVVAASTRDLRPLVSTGRFCPQLASAISALQIHAPALRERAEDIPALLTHMIDYESRQLDLITPPPSGVLLEALAQQTWPGNLEQLLRTAQRLLQSTEPANPAEFPDFIDNLLEEPPVEAPSPATAPATSAEPLRMIKLEDVVQQHIRAVLIGCNGNKLRAAEILGISRSTLYRMLESGSSKLPFAV